MTVPRTRQGQGQAQGKQIVLSKGKQPITRRAKIEGEGDDDGEEECRVEDGKGVGVRRLAGGTRKRKANDDVDGECDDDEHDDGEDGITASTGGTGSPDSGELQHYQPQQQHQQSYSRQSFGGGGAFRHPDSGHGGSGSKGEDAIGQQRFGLGGVSSSKGGKSKGKGKEKGVVGLVQEEEIEMDSGHGTSLFGGSSKARHSFPTPSIVHAPIPTLPQTTRDPDHPDRQEISRGLHKRKRLIIQSDEEEEDSDDDGAKLKQNQNQQNRNRKQQQYNKRDDAKDKGKARQSRLIRPTDNGGGGLDRRKGKEKEVVIKRKSGDEDGDGDEELRKIQRRKRKRQKRSQVLFPQEQLPVEDDEDDIIDDDDDDADGNWEVDHTVPPPGEEEDREELILDGLPEQDQDGGDDDDNDELEIVNNDGATNISNSRIKPLVRPPLLPTTTKTKTSQTKPRPQSQFHNVIDLTHLATSNNSSPKPPALNNTSRRKQRENPPELNQDDDDDRNGRRLTMAKDKDGRTGKWTASELPQKALGIPDSHPSKASHHPSTIVDIKGNTKGGMIGSKRSLSSTQHPSTITSHSQSQPPANNPPVKRHKASHNPNHQPTPRNTNNNHYPRTPIPTMPDPFAATATPTNNKRKSTSGSANSFVAQLSAASGRSKTVGTGGGGGRISQMRSQISRPEPSPQFAHPHLPTIQNQNRSRTKTHPQQQQSQFHSHSQNLNHQILHHQTQQQQQQGNQHQRQREVEEEWRNKYLRAVQGFGFWLDWESLDLGFDLNPSDFGRNGDGEEEDQVVEIRMEKEKFEKQKVEKKFKEALDKVGGTLVQTFPSPKITHVITERKPLPPPFSIPPNNQNETSTAATLNPGDTNAKVSNGGAGGKKVVGKENGVGAKGMKGRDKDKDSAVSSLMKGKQDPVSGKNSVEQQNAEQGGNEMDIVSQAQGMGLKIWSFEKLELFLIRLIEPGSPVKRLQDLRTISQAYIPPSNHHVSVPPTPPHNNTTTAPPRPPSKHHRSLSTVQGGASSALPALLRSELLSGRTKEHDPHSRRADFYYFPARCVHLLVEDQTGEHRPIAVEEWDKPIRKLGMDDNDGGGQPMPWPVLFGGAEGKSAFITLEEATRGRNTANGGGGGNEAKTGNAKGKGKARPGGVMDTVRKRRMVEVQYRRELEKEKMRKRKAEEEAEWERAEMEIIQAENNDGYEEGKVFDSEDEEEEYGIDAICNNKGRSFSRQRSAARLFGEDADTSFETDNSPRPNLSGPSDAAILPNNHQAFLRRASSYNNLREKIGGRRGTFGEVSGNNNDELLDIEEDEASTFFNRHPPILRPKNHALPGQPGHGGRKNDGDLLASGNSVQHSTIASGNSAMTMSTRSGVYGSSNASYAHHHHHSFTSANGGIDKRLLALKNRQSVISAGAGGKGGNDSNSNSALKRLADKLKQFDDEDGRKMSSMRGKLKRSVSIDAGLNVHKGGGMTKDEGLRRKVMAPRVVQEVEEEEEKKPGYCENCRGRYEDFKEHVISKKHMKFAKNDDNWRDIDDVLFRISPYFVEEEEEEEEEEILVYEDEEGIRDDQDMLIGMEDQGQGLEETEGQGT